MARHIHIHLHHTKDNGPAHDPKNGQFTSGSGGGSTSKAASPGSKFHHPDGTPKTRGGDWKSSVSKGKADVARLRNEGKADKHIVNHLYNTHQNVPKRHFSQFLTELGVSHNAADFRVSSK